MLQVALQSTVILFVVSIYGWLFCNLFNLKLANPLKTAITGFFLIAILARIAHFFIPAGLEILLFLLASSLLAYGIKRNAINQYFGTTLQALKKEWLLFLAIFAFLCIYHSLPSIAYDDGLYHSGFIKWLNSFKVLKGLANVENRFGFNSNWHLLAAVFNGFGIFEVPANCINVPLVFIFVWMLRLDAVKATAWRIQSLVIFFPLFLLYQLVSPTPDLFISLLVYKLVLEIFYASPNADKNEVGFWFICFTFMLTLKLSAALIFPIVILYALRYWKGVKIFLPIVGKVAVAAILLLAPWVLSNIFISGYVVFPYAIPLPKLQWCVPAAEVMETIRGIKFTPVAKAAGISFDVAEKMDTIERLLMLIKTEKLVVKLLGFAFFISWIWLLFLGKKSTKVVSAVLLFTLVLFVIAVPDIRFFYGPGLAGISILITHLLQSTSYTNRLAKKYGNMAFYTLLAIQFVALFYLYVHLYPKVLGQGAFNRDASIIKKSQFVYPAYSFKRIEQNAFVQPVDCEFCWDSIPCINILKPNLRLMGNTIHNGFYQTDGH